MLYKSKVRVLYIVLSSLFAIAAIVFAIINIVNGKDLYLTLAIGLAMFFFIFKGLADYIQSKYCERKDRTLVRGLSYFSFAGAAVCLVLFIVQLVLLLK